MTVNEMAPAVETRRAFSAFNSNWEIHGHDKSRRGREQIRPCSTECWRANLSAGGQIFGIEKAASVGRQEEKLTIGTPDGFVEIDVVLNQPNIDAVLRETTAGVVKHACELRTPPPPALRAASLVPSIHQKK
jgi:hypothetical protein